MSDTHPNPSSFRDEDLSDRTSDHLVWAASVLRAPRDTSADALRARLLQRLEASQFSSSDELWQAAGSLTADHQQHVNPLRHPAFHQWSEDHLQLRVDDFVRQYFEFAPRERKPRHGLLQSQAKYFPRVLFRLKALEPGLNTELVKAKSDEPLIAELAGYCAELFLLKPCMRAQRRREIVSDLRSRMTEYQRAAARLLKRYPDIAALAPDLIPPLASHFKLIRKAARRRTQAAIVRIKRPPMKKTSGLPWIAVVAIVATTSAISRWSSNQSDNYPYQAPNYQYQAPTYSLRDIHVPVFTPSPSPQQPGDQRLIQDGGTVVGRLLEDRRNGTLKAEGDTDSVETSQGTMILRKGKTGFTIERGGPPGQDAKLPSALRPSPPSAGGRKSP